jgi:hypothetical protein
MEAASYTADSSEQKEMVQEQEKIGEEEGGDDGGSFASLADGGCLSDNHACITGFSNIQELQTI